MTDVGTTISGFLFSFFVPIFSPCYPNRLFVQTTRENGLEIRRGHAEGRRRPMNPFLTFPRRRIVRALHQTIGPRGNLESEANRFENEFCGSRDLAACRSRRYASLQTHATTAPGEQWSLSTRVFPQIVCHKTRNTKTHKRSFHAYDARLLRRDGRLLTSKRL